MAVRKDVGWLIEVAFVEKIRFKIWVSDPLLVKREP